MRIFVVNRQILAAGCIAVALAFGASVISASASDRDRDEGDRRPLHITKECSRFTGQPGSFCTIVTSNVPEIPAGTDVFYDQANGIPKGLLDSNVALDAGGGNWALGRCTVDHSTHLGVCNFSDGLGTLSGFHGRAKVTVDSSTGLIHWDGTYSFNLESDGDR